MDEQHSIMVLAIDIVRHNGMDSVNALDLAEFLNALGYRRVAIFTMERTQYLNLPMESLDLTKTEPHDDPPAVASPPESVSEGDSLLKLAPPKNDAPPPWRGKVIRTQYDTEWTDPKNVTMPKPGDERVMSGWRINQRGKDTLACFCGERGRVVASPQWLAKHAHYEKSSEKGGRTRQRIYLRQAPNALVRKGLLEMADKDLYQLSPRGRMFVKEILGLQPTPKQVGVSTTT